MNGSYAPGDVVFGKWKLTRLLGEGSYGRVFEAVREDFGVSYKAAVKIITIPQNQSEIREARSEGMDDVSVTSYFQGFVEEIVKEFELMSRLKGSANVVSYEDHDVVPHIGQVGWDILIRMELLTPLLTCIQEQSLDRRDVIKLGIDILKALELCRKYNIVHRDIKPENIFVSEAGDYKLGDFGIARTVEKTTGGLSKKGTYTYMAPEVYREQAYGPAVDIYSLGIVLYRMLNDNRAPFLPAYPAPITHADRENATAMRLGGARLAPPKNADGRLGEIVLKACSYQPGDRYSDPAQMRRELESLLYGSDFGSYAAAASISMAAKAAAVHSAPPVQPQQEKTTGLFEAPFSAQPPYEQPRPVQPPSEQPRPESTVGLFGGAPQAAQPCYAQQPDNPPLADAPQPKKERAAAKPEGKKPKKKALWFIIGGAVLVAVIAVVCVLLFRGGPAGKASEGPAAAQTGAEAEEEVFTGETFPSMLWGDYSLLASTKPNDEGELPTDSEVTNAFAAGMKFEMVELQGEQFEVSSLPMTVKCGPGWKALLGFFPETQEERDKYYEKNFASLGETGKQYYANFQSVLARDMLRITVCDKTEHTYNVYAAYEVKGNKLYASLVTALDDTTWEMSLAPEPIEFTFEVKGGRLVLKRNGCTAEYVDEYMNFDYPEKNGIYITDAHANEGNAYNEIESISYFRSRDEATGSAYVIFTDGQYAIDSVIEFSGEDELTLSWQERYYIYNGRTEMKSDPTTLNLRYISSNPGIILIADGKYYRYQTTYKQDAERRLSGVVDVDVSTLSESQTKELVTTQQNILFELDTAFEEAGIEASVDPTTGKVSMDSSILFDYNDYSLSDVGKAYLDGFLDVYASVILSDAYTGCISEIMVEGHTDSSGNYDSNMTLSENRAASVADYCLSRQPELASIMQTKGCSSDTPVLDESGNEDAEASRRVVFRFILNTNL